MLHTYIDPQHSVFRFGDIEARVDFSGDVHDPRKADVQQWRFLLHHPQHGPLDITASLDDLDSDMTDAGLADVFRARHCPKAAKARSLAGVAATLVDRWS